MNWFYKNPNWFYKKYGFGFKIQSKYLDLDYVKIQISFIKNMDQDLKFILNIWTWIGFSKIQSMTTLRGLT